MGRTEVRRGHRLDSSSGSEVALAIEGRLPPFGRGSSSPSITIVNCDRSPPPAADTERSPDTPGASGRSLPLRPLHAPSVCFLPGPPVSRPPREASKRKNAKLAGPCRWLSPLCVLLRSGLLPSAATAVPLCMEQKGAAAPPGGIPLSKSHPEPAARSRPPGGDGGGLWCSQPCPWKGPEAGIEEQPGEEQQELGSVLVEMREIRERGMAAAPDPRWAPSALPKHGPSHGGSSTSPQCCSGMLFLVEGAEGPAASINIYGG
ncbi:uncharacterized protein LOC107198684 [Parus major]|uniref:uncharacterized protein LOC107198684 n=1 Tax=Parus major TaxID=9157 RepID=UPI0007711634|nr:uncharacterized protein LOC107198684 [Parus major]XP_015471312.1 uncharacterized protein LOC107198684 [Parus major]